MEKMNRRKRIGCDDPTRHFGIWYAYYDDEENPTKLILECTYCGNTKEFLLKK